MQNGGVLKIWDWAFANSLAQQLPTLSLIGIVGGGVGVAIAGLLGTRKAVDSPPLATIRELT